MRQRWVRTVAKLRSGKVSATKAPRTSIAIPAPTMMIGLPTSVPSPPRMTMPTPAPTICQRACRVRTETIWLGSSSSSVIQATSQEELDKVRARPVVTAESRAQTCEIPGEPHVESSSDEWSGSIRNVSTESN